MFGAIALAAAACGDAASTEGPQGTSGGGSGSASGGSSSGAGSSTGSGGSTGSSGSTSGGGSGSTSSGGTGSGGTSSDSSGGGTSSGGSTSSGGGADAGGPDDASLPPWDASAPPWDGALVDAACGEDPTAGFTEYQDTYKVQHPYNLTEADRFSASPAAGGFYTAWIYPTDLPYSMGSPTGPRTEMRWLQNWNTGEREWEGDVLVDSPTDHACIMQVKTDTPNGHEAIYLDVYKGNLLNGPGPVVATNVLGQWMHLNVAYNTATRVARVWLNGCLVFTRTHPVDALWYFKNGVYGCDSAICRSHFQNIRFWQR
jgi:hypothetical protein